MKIKRRSRPGSARIEMVPLIDIVFLLLVFFIYAMLSMAVHRGMNLDLPDSSDPVRSGEALLSVSVAVEEGMPRVYLDQEEVSLQVLETMLHRRVLRADEKPGVLLFADREVSYQQLYEVLDRISAAGVSAISLQAERKSE
ncbi:MAG: biopolymer transporter ExbD [Desulfobulbaceae bacterium]|nr:biopolymer transporter ExbD [Desulfobulbaceae bacterium]